MYAFILITLKLRPVEDLMYAFIFIGMDCSIMFLSGILTIEKVLCCGRLNVCVHFD
jgi:hypothetical protein